MIVISPPGVKSYAPSTQPIAFADVFVQRDEQMGRTVLMVKLFDANMKAVQVDQSQIPAITPAQNASFVALGATSGNTFDQEISHRALPILAANYGLTGTVQ